MTVARIAAGAVLLLLFPVLSAASPFDCQHNRCGLLTKGNNPNIIIGTVERVADTRDMGRLYHWARTHGYWQFLPPDEKSYLQRVKILSLVVRNPDRHSTRNITVLMGPKEFRGNGIHVGDQVRYAPRRSNHYHGPDNAAAKAYWRLIGCVDVTCGAKDPSCRGRYRSGVYRHDDGRELDPATGKLVAHGVRIDPVSLFQVTGTKTGDRASGMK